ncbi:lytic transglycosylase domain-containing protein [Methylobacillus arboreus]|uniref:lytic transglycosylase domain-containing protein n=1 Tax=Methylobacillus arboreus TaxID=755170 RepID=UPI001E426E18|nr:lytic transglycosylase domain-containing protein [Methylobacillus arboreus]MCB5190462.1 lytic transglycosylase domain-containing protein [Methylobacillus arboreus]
MQLSKVGIILATRLGGKSRINMMDKGRTMLALLLISAGFLTGSQAVHAASPDDVFLSARNAYNARNANALATASQSLQAQHYILAPYTDYWRLLLTLNQADKQSVQGFLERYSDLPFADRARGEWLKVLARRQDWTTFFEEYPKFNRDDAAVSCYAADGGIQQGLESAVLDGKALWMTGSDLPANCNAVFDRLQKGGVLREEDIWARTRLLLQGSKITVAKTVLQRLPDIDKANLKLLDRVYQNPQQVLEKGQISFKSKLGRELNLYALERLSRSQPALALDLWEKLHSNFEPADRDYFWSRFALHAARKHDPAALTYFQRAGNAELDKDQREWKARAAMRAGDWKALQSTITEMPESQQEEQVWQYWKARALKEQKQIVAANLILVRLSKENTYYGLLSEEEMGDVLTETPAPYKVSAEEVRTVLDIPGIQRALALRRLEMRSESREEWRFASGDFDDKQLIAAAEVAFREGWYDIAISTADRTKLLHDFALRYPTPYRDMMQGYAADNSLDEAWVYGLIRQESRFVSWAKSVAGASGLMQVMPATAKWIAKRMGMGDYKPAMINQLDTNLKFGTHYLRYTMDKMDQQPLMATAAYNAGPGRPKRWASDKPLEGAIYAETIPFSETRDYVKKVLGNSFYYSQQLGTKQQTLKQRLGVVPGVGAPVNPEQD